MFVAVVEAGGFRLAAQRLGLPASTVSDLVRRLEERLGARLLNRSTRSVMPTEVGRRLYTDLRPAFDKIDQAVRSLLDDGRSPKGTLRLSVAGIAARYILPAILPDFLNACPDVRVEVVVDEHVVDIIEGGFDAAIRYEERVAGDMTTLPIGPPIQRFVAAASPRYLDERGVPQHPKELSAHRLIGHRLPSGAIFVWEFGQGRQALRVTPEASLITSSIELRIASAIAGVGVIYTFEEVLRPHLSDRLLLPLLQPWWQSFPGPLICYHGDRQVPAPLSAFLAHVRARSAVQMG